jgi:excisionase family DNA binding protein
MINNNQFELFSLKETASQLHISVSTLRRFIKNNQIKIIKVGGELEFQKRKLIIFFLQIKKQKKR